ncbi:hypothetical protein RHECNPAF_6420059 [Rhizobium etli CNPAF512]|nr:hypothetical protein RHECNPAF_6420059 [Rhizobium etli CNPAF512]
MQWGAGDTERYKLPARPRKRRRRCDCLVGRCDCIRVYPGGRTLHSHSKTTGHDIPVIQAERFLPTVIHATGETDVRANQPQPPPLLRYDSHRACCGRIRCGRRGRCPDGAGFAGNLA